MITQQHPHVVESLALYISDGIPPGGFLMAILTNDLREAVGHADHINLRLIPEYVSYLWNDCPSVCWGSPEKVEGWLAHHEMLRTTKEKGNSDE